MTLRNFLKGYGFNKCISIYDKDIQGNENTYCNGKAFLKYDKELRIEKRLECWNEIKDRKVKRWNIIDGGELCIELEKEG
jgi:hypothetical protein